MSGDADLENLENMLGKALAAPREIPAGWRAAAQAAYTWRTVDEELLALVHDSAADGAAAVRGAATARSLAFSGGGLSLEVELDDGTITGELDGPLDGVAEVTVERVDGVSRTVTTDESGFFSLADEDHGLVRFAVQAASGRLVTEWVLL